MNKLLEETIRAPEFRPFLAGIVAGALIVLFIAWQFAGAWERPGCVTIGGSGIAGSSPSIFGSEDKPNFGR